jgi:hypothetical protein
VSEDAYAKPAGPRPPQLVRAERLLDERGRLLAGRIRVAVGRSGIVVGFPHDPMIHVSWWVLAALATLAGARQLSRDG